VRFLVWLLVLANIGMLGWVLVRPAPSVPEHRPISVLPGVEPLVLVSERLETVQAGKDSQAPKPTVAASAVETPNLATKPETPQPEAVVTADQQVEDIAAAPADPEEDGADQDPNEPGEPAKAGEVTAEAVETCHTIGPLAREDDAEAIRTQLSAAGYLTRLRSDAVRKPSGYWVYMPAMPAAEARRIVAELDSLGMTDYYIGKQNYISLGIFSRESKARLRLNQIRNLGFDAILDRRYRIRSEYWLDVKTGGTPLPGSEVWTKLLEERQDVSVKRVACE
jgi:hypothetical protein